MESLRLHIQLSLKYKERLQVCQKPTVEHIAHINFMQQKHAQEKK